jgi:hypothetical protein
MATDTEIQPDHNQVILDQEDVHTLSVRDAGIAFLGAGLMVANWLRQPGSKLGTAAAIAGLGAARHYWKEQQSALYDYNQLDHWKPSDAQQPQDLGESIIPLRAVS